MRILAAAVLAAFFMSTPAAAQMICGPHDQVIRKLEDRYKESQAGVGLASNGGVVQLYLSESGSWTLLLTRPTGVTCVIAGGQSWESVEANVATAEDDL